MPPPPSLPEPAGPLGHLRYSWSAVRRRRAVGRAIELLDERLRAAVAVRDEHLAALGEATLAQRAGGDRARAFSETLDRLDAEHATAEHAWEAARLEFASAEGELADARAQLEQELERIQHEIEPQRRRLEANRRALSDLTKQIESDADQRRGVQQRVHRLDEKLSTATDDEARAEWVEARRGLQARLAEWPDTSARADEAERLRATLDPTEDAIDGLERHLKQAREDGEAAVAAAKASVEALTLEVDQSKQRVERLISRRRAVLMDLGHEVLHAFPEDRSPAQESARAAVTRIEALRTERRALEQQRSAVDLAPVERTVKVLGAAVLAALLLWWWL